jgi:hypothetical protein
MANRVEAMWDVEPWEYDDEIVAGDCGVDSSVRLKTIYIHSFEDTLWWIELLVDKLTDPEGTAVARHHLLARTSFVLDVMREQIGVHRQVLGELEGECAPSSEQAVEHLRNEYKALLPLIDAVAAAVAALDAEHERRAAMELRRRSTRLIDATRSVLENDTLVVPRTQFQGD